MPIKLSSFIENLSNVVRPNRFLVLVTPPPDLVSGLDSTVLMYYAQSAVIPERSFSEIDFKYFGMTLKVPGNENPSEMNITFILDEEWETRDTFEDWCNVINDRADSSKEYMQNLFKGSSIVVNQLGKDGSTIASYEFYNVFPKMIGEVALNQETVDSFSTFDVTFCFSHFSQLDVSDSE